MLEDQEYLTKLKAKLKHWVLKYNILEDNRIKWEFIKYKVKKFSIKYSKLKAKLKKKICEIESEIKMLKSNLRNDNLEQYNDKKHELEHLLGEK